MTTTMIPAKKKCIPKALANVNKDKRLTNIVKSVEKTYDYVDDSGSDYANKMTTDM